MNESSRISISTGTIIRTILCLILFWVLFALKNLVLVVLSAIIIASAVEPITVWFRKFKIPRVLAAAFVYILVVTILSGIVYILLPRLLQEMVTVFDTLQRFSTVPYLQPVFEGLSGTLPAREVLQNIANSLNGVSGGLVTTISSIFGGVISFLVIVVISFYLSVQKDGVGDFLRLITPARDEKYVADIWQRAQTKMGLWMQGQLLLTVIIGVLTYVGLLALGVRDALILAILTGLMELIPLFGPVIALVPAVALGYIDGGLTLSLMILILYLIIHQLENHVIYPLVVRKIVGVNPVVVIVALLAGFELAGFLGMIVAVPMAAVGIELLRDFRNKQ